MNKPRYRIWDKKYNRWNTGRPSMDKLFVLIDRTILEFNSDRYILQTSTGKFDKNGVEIFEGDIVRCDFVDECFSNNKYGETGKCSIDTSLDIPSCGGPEGSDYYNNIEVIGNIFKNPELLPKNEN